MKKIDNNIFFIKNKDFQTIQIKVVFPFYDVKEDIAHVTLLPSMVSYMNEEYDTEEKFQINRQKNYILAAGCTKNVVGTNIFFTYSMIIPDTKSLEINMLDKQFEFFEKLIYHPKIIDGGFDSFELEREKKDLKTRISNGMKNLDIYRSIKFTEAFDTIGIASRGIHNNLQLIDLVTPTSLYNFYKKNIYDNNPIVFVFGDFDEDEIKQLINKYILKEKMKEISYEEQFNYFLEPRDEVYKVNDKGHFKDSAISLAYKVKNMTEDDFVILSIVSNLLSSMSSRLLQKVLRDQHELIYSSTSCSYLRLGVLEITAYINKKNKDLVIEKIQEVLMSLKDEEFIKEFLDNIIDRRRLNLKQMLDNRSALLDDVVCKELGIDVTAEEKYEVIKKINTNDIANFIDRLVLDTIYFVEEEDNE